MFSDKDIEKIEKYKHLIKKGPQNPELYNILGELYLSMGNIPEAITQFLQAAELFSQAREEFNNYVKAIGVYKKIIRLQPDDSVQHLLAEVYIKKGSLGDARKIYECLGQEYIGNRDYTKAIKVWEKIFNFNPDDIDLRLKCTKLKTRVGMILEASHEYRQIAEHYYNLGDIDNFLEFYQKSLDLAPPRKNLDKKIKRIEDFSLQKKMGKEEEKKLFSIRGKRTYKILIADNDLDTIKDLKFSLEKLNYICFTAFNGIRALEVFRRVKPDLLIINAVLPTLHGLEVVKRIRESKRRGGLPIIVMGNIYKDPKHKKLAGKNLKADEYIEKPFKVDEIISLINKYLDKIEERERKIIEKIKGVKYPIKKEIERIDTRLEGELEEETKDDGIKTELKLKLERAITTHTINEDMLTKEIIAKDEDIIKLKEELKRAVTLPKAKEKKKEGGEGLDRKSITEPKKSPLWLKEIEKQLRSELALKEDTVSKLKAGIENVQIDYEKLENKLGNEIAVKEKVIEELKLKLEDIGSKK